MVLIALVSVAGACKGKASTKGTDTADSTRASQRAAGLVNGVVGELKGFHGKILTVPNPVDLSTMPTLAANCVAAKPIVNKLVGLATEPDGYPQLVGKRAKTMVEAIDASCSNVTYAEADQCWKPCSLAWSHLEEAIQLFHDDAAHDKIAVSTLE